MQFAYSINVRAAEARLLPLARSAAWRSSSISLSTAARCSPRCEARPCRTWAAEVDCASWGQFFLKYILGHPAVTCVIPGTAKPEHARDNVAAGMGRLPDAAQRQRMSAYWEAGLP